MKSSPAFTLIELLVVIAIIGILMALLFPALSTAMDSAKRTQAKNDVVQLATAITAYETEYGRLPTNGGASGGVSSTFLEPLLGVSTNTNSGNPRKIVFIELNAAKKGKGGTNTNGAFVDPWGGAYQFSIDSDYDNSITNAGTNSQSIRKRAAVWNAPSTHSNSTAAQQKRRYVTSFE